MTKTDPKRRWFRFSLRTMFVVVTICSVLFGFVGWNVWKVRQRQAFYQRFVHDEVEGIRRLRRVGEEAKPPLLWTMFGAKSQDQLCLSREYFSDAEISQIISLFPEADIFVSDHHEYELPPVQWGARLKQDESD